MLPKSSKTDSIIRTYADVREGKQRASSPQRSIDHELISRREADPKPPEDHTPSAENFAMGCLSRICNGSRVAIEQALDRIELQESIQVKDIYQANKLPGVIPEYGPDFPLQKYGEPTELLEAGKSGKKPVDQLTLQEEEFPKNYLWQYVKSWKLKDGTEVTLRPTHPKDESRMEEFYKTLSDDSCNNRWTNIQNSKDEQLRYLKRACWVGYDQKMTIVAQTKEGKIIGVGELARTHNRSNKAELARIIADEYQGKGLGSKMLDQLIAIGIERRFSKLVDRFKQENPEVEHMYQQYTKRRFTISDKIGHCIAELDLLG